MATPVWISQNGDWNATASWSTGVVPVDNDTVIFDGSSQRSVTAGLDQSAVDLDLLWIKDSFRGDIGVPGASLEIAADVVSMQGGGILRINGTHATKNLDVVVCDSRSGSVLVDGKLARGFSKAGTLVVEPGVSTTPDVYTVGIAAVTHVQGTAVAANEIYVQSGTCHLERAVVGVTVVGTQGKLIKTKKGLGGPLISMGTVNYKPTVTPVGTLPLVAVLGGVFDLEEAQFEFTSLVSIIGPFAHISENALANLAANTLIDLRRDAPDAATVP